MSAGSSSLCSTGRRAHCPAKHALEQSYCLLGKTRNSYGETPCNVSEEDTDLQKKSSNQTLSEQQQFGPLLIMRESFPPLFLHLVVFNLSAISAAQWRLSHLTGVITCELPSSSQRTTNWGYVKPGKAWVPTGVKKIQKTSWKIKIQLPFKYLKTSVL